MEKNRMLVKVASLYYLENKTQQEIASILGLSRASVSRYLTQAQKEGLVRIKINNPYSIEIIYAEELKKYFPNIQFHVVNSAQYNNDNDFYREFANEMCDVIRPAVSSGIVVGVSAGETLGKISSFVDNINASDAIIVPLLGGEYMTKTSWQANVIARVIAEKFNADTYQLYAPFKALNKQSKELFVSEPTNKAVLEIMDNASIVLTGIGDISSNPDILSERLLKQEELEDLNNKNVSGNLCCTFLNINGENVKTSFDDCLIGISSEKLKNVPLVVGSAIGKRKAKPVISAINGNWVNVLIIDTELAKELIKLVKKKEK